MKTASSTAFVFFFLSLLPLKTTAATPLHHYTFDGTAVVDSVGSANGTLLNGAALSSGVLRLDGTNAYVQFAEKLVPTSGAFSVAFFAVEYEPTSDRAEVISQGSWFGPGFYLGYYPPERSLRVGDEWQSTRLGFPAAGLMHHYAVTTDGLGARLYLDGICRATNSPIHIANDGYDTRLGRQFDPWAEFFHGDVDELWVFSGALTGSEVAELAAVKPLGPDLRIEVSQVRLCWQSETNVSYQVQYRSLLTSNVWTNLGSPVSGNNETICTTDEVSAPGRLYRLVRLP